MNNATTFCGDCHTVDGCVCPVAPKPRRTARPRPPQEREDIVAFLRRGGETIRGQWYSWDSEMAGYAKSFADRIERGDHRPPLPDRVRRDAGGAGCRGGLCIVKAGFAEHKRGCVS